MAEICCGVVSDGESAAAAGGGCETTSSRAARRRRVEIRGFKFVTTAIASASSESAETKRQRMEISASSSISRECDKAVDRLVISDCERQNNGSVQDDKQKEVTLYQSPILSVKSLGISSTTSLLNIQALKIVPKFGVASVCGRRRDMEDAVAVHPSFIRPGNDNDSEFHYFAVYDGHGCSHVRSFSLPR